MTPAQRHICDVIAAHKAQHGVNPKLKEILAASGHRSYGGLHDMLSKLVARGVLRSNRQGRRKYEVVERA